MLIILSDQHRADCMTCAGNPDLRTPSLDALARDGVNHRNCFTVSPVCTPSRYSLLSGRYVHEHRGWTNQSTYPLDMPGFPELLKAAGYRTAAVGKMHFTPTYRDVGFERMVLAEQDGPGRWDDDYHRELRELGLVDINDLEDQRAEYRENARPEYWEHLGALPSSLPSESHSTAWIGRQALRELGQWEQEGELLMVGFVKPHHPFDPPRDWAEAYDPSSLSLLPGWTSEPLPRDCGIHRGYFPHETVTEPRLRRVMAYYYATIEQMDREIGRMIELLKRRGLYDNTLIVYLSDHGEYLGYHHMLLKGGYTYDPLARVPLIVKYPQQQGAGTSSGAMVSTLEVAPTLLTQAGVPPDPGMRGFPLVDPQTGEAAPGRNVVFAEYAMNGQAMARTQTHKLLVSNKMGQTLFFDLEADPCELDNRAGAGGAVYDALHAALEEWRPIGLEPDPWEEPGAPAIDGPNVPPVDGSHRQAMIEYYARKMAEAAPGWRESPGRIQPS